MLKKSLVSFLFFISTSSIAAGGNYTLIFACADPHSAGRDSSMAEVLMGHIISGCSNCYASLITSSSVSQLCRDSGVPLTNMALMQKARQVGKKNGATFYLIKSTEMATLGVVGR